MLNRRSTLAAGIATLALVPAATTAIAAPVPSANPAAATRVGSLPDSCSATIGETTGESYFYGSKVSKYSEIALPKEGARHAGFISGAEDDRFHYLAVTSAGRVYDSSMDFGGLGDGFDVRVLDPSYVPAGSTIPGIIDLEVASETIGDYSWNRAKLALAVTADGRLHGLPMTYVKTRPRLGKPITLSAKGLSGIRGIEELGRYWVKGKVTKNLYLAHTRDGRLVELTVNRTTARPALSYKVLATGWKDVTTLAVGWCNNKPHASTTVIIAIDSAKRVTARLDPIWNDASLRGAATIQLAPWKRGPANTLF